MRYLIILTLVLGGFGVREIASASAASACTWQAVTVSGVPHTPYQSGSSVNTKGVFSTNGSDWYCGVDGLTVRGQTKVCGAWGCSWHTKASAFHNGQTTYWSKTVSQPCRSGTNRYKTRVTVAWIYNNWPSGWASASSSADSAVQPEFTCK